MENKCFNHPEKDSVNFCHSCKLYYCADCLVEGGDYYFCKGSNCQSAFHNEISRSETKEEKKTTAKPQTNKLSSNIINFLKHEKTPLLNIFILLNGLFIFFIAVVLLRYKIANLGIGSVVLSNYISKQDIGLIITGVALVGLAIFMIIKSGVSIHKSLKEHPSDLNRNQVGYVIGCISAITGLFGFIAMIAFFIQKKINMAIQVIFLTITFFVLERFIYDVGAYIEAAMTIHRLLNPYSFFMVKLPHYKYFFWLFINVELKYIISPILLVAAVRFVGIKFRNR